MGGLSSETLAAQKQAYSECKNIAPMMLGDYYPLTPYNREAGGWIAWQFNRPEQRDGFVQAFRRRECSEVRMTFLFNGLDPKARYEITNFDVEGKTITTGKKLMKEGLSVEIKDKPGAAVFTYRMMK
jgi:hypothetical protein